MPSGGCSHTLVPSCIIIALLHSAFPFTSSVFIVKQQKRRIPLYLVKTTGQPHSRIKAAIFISVSRAWASTIHRLCRNLNIILTAASSGLLILCTDGLFHHFYFITVLFIKKEHSLIMHCPFIWMHILTILLPSTYICIHSTVCIISGFTVKRICLIFQILLWLDSSWRTPKYVLVYLLYSELCN